MSVCARTSETTKREERSLHKDITKGWHVRQKVVADEEAHEDDVVDDALEIKAERDINLENRHHYVIVASLFAAPA